MKAVAVLKDRATLAMVAAALVAVGLFALFWTVQVDGYDRWGFRIGCGTAVASSYEQAALADQEPPPPPQPQSGYVDGCESAILWRRVWATALIALGGGALMTFVPRADRQRADVAVPGDQ